MIQKILHAIIGTKSERDVKRMQPTVERINSLEPDLQKLSDIQLRAKTQEFKQRLSQGETLNDLLPEAFAVAREATKRTLNQRHYDVQIIGGIVLHAGQVAEMRTGEGKTQTSVLPLYLNALSGKGVHLVTVNDYLAKRDAVWMGQIFDFLGLTIGVIVPEESFIYDSTHTTEKKDETRDQGIIIEKDFLRPVPRKEAYLADITYGTNNEFGFDYLRDNMVQDINERVQRKLNYAIVDEVDSILIDEARTPLIISAPDVESTDKYVKFAQLVETLKENEDYNVDEKLKAATLTDAGISKLEKALGVDNIYEQEGIETVHHIEQALKAKTLFFIDKEYVVKDGEILIVDEFTGRILPGRRYSEGLHQAIEAKEGVAIQRENRTMATITFQNYFRIYEKLAGMTGTAATEAEEMAQIYNLEVTTIPTHMPMVRKDHGDKIFKNETGKYRAIVEEIKRCQKIGQPVLVGTISIEKNELLAGLLDKAGVQYNMLNAKQHEKEATVIAQAGNKAAVTIATNMAGRGVDIKLGGIPFDQKKYDEIKALGGLYVIGTERHESRRIDNQLRGRSGRQGDPGASQFYVSMDDDLMRIFGSDRMKTVMSRLGLDEDTPIENKVISRSIESAQKKVEGHNFDIRKHLVEYDDIINKQRQFIYEKRTQILTLSEQNKGKETDSPLSPLVLEDISTEIINTVSFHTNDSSSKNWNIKEIKETMMTIFPFSSDEQKEFEELSKKNLGSEKLRDDLTDYLVQLATKKHEDLKYFIRQNLTDIFVDKNPVVELEKSLILRAIDMHWIEHLDTISLLRTGIGLRGYGQRDPLVEYKRESKQLFDALLDSIRKQVVYSIFKVTVANKMTAPPLANPKQMLEQKGSTSAFRGAEERPEKQIIQPKPTDEEGRKIGRNDLCWCGSGKKFKKCHGA